MQETKKRYWFAIRPHGLDMIWVPARWQGWALITAYVAVFVTAFIQFVMAGATPSLLPVAKFALSVFTATALFAHISRRVSEPADD